MLAGKKAIVTGGSAGIGAAITEALVSVGVAAPYCRTVWTSCCGRFCLHAPAAAPSFLSFICGCTMCT